MILRYKKKLTKILFLFLIILMLFPLVLTSVHASDDKNKVLIAGYIKDTHNHPIKEVEIKCYINGKLVAKKLTSWDGGYTIEFYLFSPPKEVRLEVWKHCYEKKEIIIKENEFAKKNNEYYARVNLQLKNVITQAFYLSAAILIFVYILIAL